MIQLPTRQQVRTGKSIYGEPIEARPHKNLKIGRSPFPLKLAWNPKQTTSKIACHKLLLPRPNADCNSLITPNIVLALTQVLEHYGLKEIDRLGINIYAGSWFYRKARGSKALSLHAYSVAFDFHPTENGHQTLWKDALFSQPAYVPFLDIMEENGFNSLGRKWGKDAMHFEAVR